jgi:hypothetical protein
MTKTKTDLILGYEYIPTPDAAERIEEAWDIIFELILEDYLAELEENGEDETDLAARESVALQ